MLTTLFSVGYVYLWPRFCVFLWQHGTFWIPHEREPFICTVGKWVKHIHASFFALWCHFRFLSICVSVLFPSSATQTRWSNSGVKFPFKGIHAEQGDFPRQSKQGLGVVWSYTSIQGIFFSGSKDAGMLRNTAHSESGMLQVCYIAWEGDSDTQLEFSVKLKHDASHKIKGNTVKANHTSGRSTCPVGK